MKKYFCLFTFLYLLSAQINAQQVKGLIYADTAKILVVKVWGTHQERGYALGYLTGDRITDVIVNYVKPEFGPYYSTARNIIIQGNDLSIPQDYKDEAQSVIEGMNAAGLNTNNLDQTDILVGNTFLDVSNLLFKKAGMNCSALMSWNDATSGTDLNGKSVITRHLDWEYSAVLNRNHIITVHFPQELTESKWLLIGFSGTMSILSGFNPDFGAFQNMMDDFAGSGLHNKQYLPIWFALRKAIEAADYNGDGARNVQDVKSVLTGCSNGFADGYLVSALSRSGQTDSLVAMVAELAPVSPTHTFRNNNYPDSIPGDNLYTANNQIARNNAMNFCPRYNNIRSHIGNGTLIGLDTSWNLMRDYSHLSTNTQFMQYAPEMNYLRISVFRDGHPAYLNDPVVFDLNDLFENPALGIQGKEASKTLLCYPNPTQGTLRFNSGIEPLNSIEVYDLTGKIVLHIINPATSQILDVSSLHPGYYSVRLTGKSSVCTTRFFKQ
jgi:hypothetical protein